MFDGFPDLGQGIKVGFHHGGRHIQPDELKQEWSPEEIKEIQDIARAWLAIDPVFQTASVCMYTNSDWATGEPIGFDLKPFALGRW